MARLGSAESVVRFRNRYRCRDGTYRWLEWTAHPTGRPDEAVYGSARDVSEVVAQEQVIAFRDGLLSLITDAQARYNLRNLFADDGKLVTVERETLVRLCATAGLGPETAEQILAGLASGWRTGGGGGATPEQIAAAILAAATATPIYADIRKVNAVTVDGAGTEADPFGPV
jgi:hypothetical protein